VDETYRMLGREHELDLAREARNRGLATAVRAERRAAPERVEAKRRDWGQRALSFLRIEAASRAPKEA
jgi:hypothetical protein